MKISNIATGEVKEYKTLDSALRTIAGPNGQPLLHKVGRKTYEQGVALLATVGLTIVAEEVKAVTVGLDKFDVERLIDNKLDNLSADLDLTVKGKINSVKELIVDAIQVWDRKLEEKKMPVEVIVNNKATGTVRNMGTQHESFPKLLTVLSCRLNALLKGPAGSGKTTGGEKAAEALGLKFYSISVGMQTTKTEFFGYMDATGRYVKTLFREAFEFGGVFLIDEMDAGNANVIVAINAALANDVCAFPDGMVKKHADFMVIAAANTWGNGASGDYIGRNPLDGATLDRFQGIIWGYDTALEDSLVSNKKWLAEVRRVRRIVEDKKIRAIVGPRASINGEKLLAAGMGWNEVKEMVLFKGMNETDKKVVG